MHLYQPSFQCVLVECVISIKRGICFPYFTDHVHSKIFLVKTLKKWNPGNSFYTDGKEDWNNECTCQGHSHKADHVCWPHALVRFPPLSCAHIDKQLTKQYHHPEKNTNGYKGKFQRTVTAKHFLALNSWVEKFRWL